MTYVDETTPLRGRSPSVTFADGTEFGDEAENHNLLKNPHHLHLDGSNGSSCLGELPEHEDAPLSPFRRHRRQPHDEDDPVSPRQRANSFSESISDIKEAIVETFEEVRDVIEEGLVEIKEEIVEVMQEPIVPVKPREEGDHNQKLSAVALAVLVFYKVSGGPFGCEPTVRAAGPLFALAGFVIFPILWAVPEALVTAELGSAFPEPSGSIAWVEEAFGPSAGLLCGYVHWVSGATDNAIYPSLFLEYVASFLRTETEWDTDSELLRFGFCVVMTSLLAFLNFTGLEIVGNLSIAIAVVSMSPFIILCILAIPKMDTSRWFVMPQPVSGPIDSHLSESWFPDPMWLGVMWRPYLNNLFWNLNSFDVGASFAGELRDPERVFPRAMFLSVIMVSLSYILPLFLAIGAVETNQSDWDAGYLAALCTKLGGHWLGAWVVFASAISNVALFEAEMSGDAYQLMGMADRGLIPKMFAKRSRFGTPTNGILLGTFVIFLLSVADFDQLVEMLNFAYSLSMILEFAAFVKLRITDDDVERPYKIPVNVFGAILFVIPPCLICLYLMFIASRVTYIYFFILMIMGMLFHLVQKAAKHHNWWEYEQQPKKVVKRKSATTATLGTPGAMAATVGTAGGATATKLNGATVPAL